MIRILNANTIDAVSEKEETVNIEIDGGVVTRIQSEPFDDECDARVIDASGLTLTQGFCDVHVHFRDPGFEYKEDIYTGAKASAARFLHLAVSLSLSTRTALSFLISRTTTWQAGPTVTCSRSLSIHSASVSATLSSSMARASFQPSLSRQVKV